MPKRKRTSTGNKQGARRINAMVKAAQALELRKAGASYRQIKETVGYRHTSSAQAAVKAALKYMLQEPTDEVRAMEASRLDSLLMAVWPAAIKGDMQAMDRVLKIMDRRARLLGLDMQKPLIEINQWVQLLQRYDFSGCTDEQLNRLEAGEEPWKVLGDGRKLDD